MRLSDLPFTAIGGQPAFEKADLEKFVSGRRIGVLSYTKRDGTPSQAPIWYRYQDGVFKMISGTPAPKTKGLIRAGKASMTIQDEMPPYRAVIVDGDIEHEPAPAKGGLSEWLAIWYFGKLGGQEFIRMTEDDYEAKGVTQITLVPKRVRGFDNTQLVGVGLRAFMRLREALPIPRTWL